MFNSNVFNIQDYRQQLENFLLLDYDWNNENENFKNNANAVFGTNWKSEVAKAISWIGLEGTNDYISYENSYVSNPQQYFFVSQIRNLISSTNNNCP